MGSASKMGVASNRCTAKRNRTTINKDKDQRVYIGRLVVGHIIIDGLLGISPGIWFSRYQMIISWDAQVCLKKSTPESMVSWFISTSPIEWLLWRNKPRGCWRNPPIGDSLINSINSTSNTLPLLSFRQTQSVARWKSIWSTWQKTLWVFKGWKMSLPAPMLAALILKSDDHAQNTTGTCIPCPFFLVGLSGR